MECPDWNTPAIDFMKNQGLLRDWYVVQMDEESQPIC
jgi:hypothetical protein